MTKQQIVVRTLPYGYHNAIDDLQLYLNNGYNVVMVNKITNDNLSVEALEYILEKQDELEINSKEVLEIIKEQGFLFVEKGQLYCGRYGDIEVLLEEDDFQDKHEYELLKEVFGNE